MEEQFEDFAKRLSFYLAQLIPIIGEEVFFVEDGDTPQPLRSYVVDKFLNKYHHSIRREEIERIKADGYYGISRLRKALGNTNDFEYDYKEFVNSAKGKIKVHQAVVAYINTIKPNLILTTSPFNLLDNCFSGYKSLWFDPEREANFDEISTSSICHIFGKAGVCNVKWVAGEEELLDFLHAWNNARSLGRTFLNNFNRHSLLILGCDAFPDWIFRFLWYPLAKSHNPKGKGFLLSNNDEGSTVLGTTAEHSVPPNLSFAAFLSRINYEKSEDMYRLLERAIKILQDNGTNLPQKRYDFFISYASEDEGLAKEIRETLVNAGLNVWLDVNRPDDLDGQYWVGIDRAINNSIRFMPIITPHYIERFFSRKRIEDLKVSALEMEQERIVRKLRERYDNDHQKMAKQIIPVMTYGKTATVCPQGREFEIELNYENMDELSRMANPWFTIFHKINILTTQSEGDKSIFKTDLSRFK